MCSFSDQQIYYQNHDPDGREYYTQYHQGGPQETTPAVSVGISVDPDAEQYPEYHEYDPYNSKRSETPVK